MKIDKKFKNGIFVLISYPINIYYIDTFLYSSEKVIL